MILTTGILLTISNLSYDPFLRIVDGIIGLAPYLGNFTDPEAEAEDHENMTKLMTKNVFTTASRKMPIYAEHIDAIRSRVQSE